METISRASPPGYPQRVIDQHQIRAARALLDISQRELADRAGVSVSVIKSAENGRDVRSSAMAAIEAALTDAGILFLDPGDTRSGGRGLRFRQP